MPMPNMNELSQIYGNWNPEAYLQGRQQVDLSNQYENGRIQEQGQDIRTKELANIFSEQDNPNKVQNRVLTNQGLEKTNEGLGYDNVIKGVNSRTATAMEPFNINKQQMEAIKSIKQSDLDMGEIQAKQMAMSQDPAVRAQGEQLLSFTSHVRDIKMKHDNEMEKERYTQGQQTGRMIENNQSAERIANIGANSRQNVANTRSNGSTSQDFWSTYNKMKTARDKHSSLVAEAMRIGPESPDYPVLVRMADAIRPQAEAEISATKPGSIDVGTATGMPTNAGPQIAPPNSKPSLPSGWSLKK